MLESGFMEEIEISVDERNKLKDCLRTHQSFRKTIGYATGAKAAINPDKKISFLAGTTPAAEELFQLAADMIYSRTWDKTYHAAILERQYAKDVMRQSPAKELFEVIKEKATEEKTKTALPDAASDVECAGSASEQEAEEKKIVKKFLGQSPTKQKPAKDGGDPDRGTHIGTILGGEELWSKDLKPELARQIMAVLDKCIEIVDRDCGFIVGEHDDSEAVIAEKIRKHSFIGKCPDKKTAVVYGVGSSGSSQANPSNNPPPFRREHQEKCTKAMLNSREEDGQKSQSISAKDQYYIFDMRREGNHANFAGAFTHNKSRMAMATPKKLMIIYEQESVLQRAKRVRGFATTTHMENQGCVIISRDTLGHDLDVRGRLHLEGDNRSTNFYPVKALSYEHQFEFLCYPKDRETIIGKENVVGLSGSAYNTESNFASNPNKKEPCFFFENPYTLGMEMIHAYNWQRIVHFTAGNGWLATAGYSNACARRLRVLHRDAQKRIASTYGICCLHAEAGSRMQKPLRPKFGRFGPEGRGAFEQGQRADNAHEERWQRASHPCKEEQSAHEGRTRKKEIG